MDSNTVALIPCRDYTPSHVEEAVSKLFSYFGGPQKIIKPGQRVLIKPNLVASFEVEKGETTHPSIIEVLIKIIKSSNAHPFIGDGPAFGSAHGVARVCGIAAVARRYQVPIVKFKANKDIYRMRVPLVLTSRRPWESNLQARSRSSAYSWLSSCSVAPASIGSDSTSDAAS